jgi:hypothetical protein
MGSIDCSFDNDWKGSNVTLSNSDKTMSHTGSDWAGVLGVDGKGSGKIYFEIYCNTIISPGAIIGIGNESANAEQYPGFSTNSWGYRENARKYYNGSYESYGSTFTTGDVIQIAADLDNNKIWFGKNNAWNGDPAAGTGEAFSSLSGSSFFPFVSGYDAVSMTLRVQPGDWSYSAPSGFSEIDCGSIVADSLTVADAVDGDTVERYITDGVSLSDLIEAQGGTSFATTFENLTVNDSVDLSAEMQVSLATDDFTINDFIDGYIFPGRLTDGIGIDELIMGSFEYLETVADNLEIADQVDGINWTQWLRDNADLAVRRYFFTLTGSNDSTTDIEIPISAFQARKRTGYDSYLNVTIPGFTYATNIANRPNGEMVLEIGYEINGAIEIREEVLRVDLSKINEYKGARQRSYQLTGYRTYNFSSSIAIIQNPNYRNTEDGRLLYRFGHIDPFVNPGDTCIVGDDQFTIDYIHYNVAPNYSQMEIRET